MADTTTNPGTAVITGASTGIGAIYADRLARRGHDVLLVARNEERLRKVAAAIHADTGRTADILVADLTDDADLRRVETTLRDNESIEILVNNAGAGGFASAAGITAAEIERMVASNVTSVARLSSAAASAFVARGHGTIINISSVLAIKLLPVSSLYSATKSFVLTYTLALHEDLGPKGVRVQAVLPGAVGTTLWDGSGIELADLPPETVMSADAMVDAALAGLDAGELVTLPALPDIADWDAYQAAAKAMGPKFSLATPAERYRATA